MYLAFGKNLKFVYIMETPLTNHISKKDYESVYEPAEDTFLLLDALESDLNYIKNLNPKICVEIGSGSGVIITALSKKLKYSLCIATDINEKACDISRKTAFHNSTIIDAINTDLITCFRNNCIDLLIFNPPYVVTDNDYELNTFSNKDIINSWSGGANGNQIIYKLLNNLNNILSDNCVFYLLLLKENEPHMIAEKLKNDKFNVCVLMERKIPGEHLFILKITR